MTALEKNIDQTTRKIRVYEEIHASVTLTRLIWLIRAA